MYHVNVVGQECLRALAEMDIQHARAHTHTHTKKKRKRKRKNPTYGHAYLPIESSLVVQGFMR